MNIVIDCRNLSRYPCGIDTYTRGLMKMYTSIYSDANFIYLVRSDMSHIPNSYVFDLNPLSLFSALIIDFVLFRLDCDIYHAAQPTFFLLTFSLKMRLI